MLRCQFLQLRFLPERSSSDLQWFTQLFIRTSRGAHGSKALLTCQQSEYNDPQILLNIVLSKVSSGACEVPFSVSKENLPYGPAPPAILHWQ